MKTHEVFEVIIAISIIAEKDLTISIVTFLGCDYKNS
jgi:hypothetical protein